MLTFEMVWVVASTLTMNVCVSRVQLPWIKPLLSPYISAPPTEPSKAVCREKAMGSKHRFYPQYTFGLGALLLSVEIVKEILD